VGVKAGFKMFIPKAELFNMLLYYSCFNVLITPCIICSAIVHKSRMRWAGHAARMREGRGVYRILVGKPEGKRPLGRPRLKWEDNITMDLQEVGCW
jgi:hypothetical protein